MKGLLGYLAGRLVQVVLTLLGVSLVTFALVHAMPGNLAQEMLGRQATPERVR